LTGAGSCAGAAPVARARQILTAAEELRLFHAEGAAIGAAKKLQLAHAPLQILNRTKELRFGTNGRPWEFDKKNQILSAPHFNF